MAAVLLVGAQIAVGALTWSETRVTDQGSSEDDASIWGDKIVFEDARHAGAADEVYLYDISSDSEMRITNDTDNQWEPIIYGDKIVWNDDREADTEVFMYDLSTGMETRVTNDAVDQGEVMIHGNHVVWAQNNAVTGWDIYRYSLVDGTTSIIDNGPGKQDYPDVFGDTIVYEDYGTPTTNADIAMHNLIDGQKTLITDEVANAKWDDDQYDPRIWGNTVAWYDYRNGRNSDIWY
ncbi:MAG: hypothetical protein PF636_11085, partial [Actinomycetota bacterium]|nr:hypothetical protein [Actinomycetota bacterium]